MINSPLSTSAVTACTIVGLLIPTAAGAANTIWLTADEPPSTRDTVSLSRGMQLCQQHRFEQAAKLFDSVHSLDLLNYRAVQQVTETYVMSGNFKQAMQTSDYLLTRVIKGEKVRDFDKGVTLKLRADAEAGLGRYESAVHDYQVAAKLKPDSTYPILCVAGEILMKTHHYKEAIETLNKAVAVGCPNGIGYKYLGECHLKLNQPDEAVKALTLSISTMNGIRKTKPDAFTVGLIGDYKLLATAYKMEGKSQLAADAQKHADSMATGWDDTLFGAAAKDPGK